MPALKYKVNLTEDEKHWLEAMISKRKDAARLPDASPNSFKSSRGPSR